MDSLQRLTVICYAKMAKALWGMIREEFQDHNIEIVMVGCHVIPSLRRYIFQIRPADGSRVQSIINRSEDVQQALGFKLFFASK